MKIGYRPGALVRAEEVADQGTRRRGAYGLSDSDPEPRAKQRPVTSAESGSIGQTRSRARGRWRGDIFDSTGPPARPSGTPTAA